MSLVGIFLFWFIADAKVLCYILYGSGNIQIKNTVGDQPPPPLPHLPPSYIKLAKTWLSRGLSLMTFWIFFQRLTFPTNTCQRLRRIYKSVEHLQWSCFFCKILKKKSVPESLFNKVAGLLRHSFYRTPPCDCFCSTEKHFTNKIVKNPLKKKMKTASKKKKQQHMQNKNLITIYIRASFPFTIHFYISFYYFYLYACNNNF